MSHLLSLLFVMAGLSGCTVIQYKSKGKVPVTFTTIRNYDTLFEHRGTCQFYLWGFAPRVCEVHVDQIALAQDLRAVGELSISEPTAFQDWFISLITFGLYWPKTYAFRGLGLSTNEMRRGPLEETQRAQDSYSPPPSLSEKEIMDAITD